MRSGWGKGWTRTAAAWGIVVGALWVITASAQGPRPGLPPLVPESLVGSVSFDLYCASCHGRQGRGDGPTAASLRTRPADLTLLARNNRGTFPRDRVLSFVEGSARAAAHGTSDMPVWGPTLRALDGSDARVTVRLQNLVAFIESMQQAPAPPPATEPAAAATAPWPASYVASRPTSRPSRRVMAACFRPSASDR